MATHIDDEAELRYASVEDTELFIRLTKDLPQGGGHYQPRADGTREAWNGSLGPHSIRCIREISELLQPKSILEIGFNVGYSAAMWLHFTKADVTSVDISDRAETLAAANTLSAKHLLRFIFICYDSGKVKSMLTPGNFDTIFIDGGHHEPEVLADIQLAQYLGIKNLVFDDYLPKYGPGVQTAIKKSGLTVTRVLGNIALIQL